MLSLAPLLFSVLLLQLANGGVGPLDALSGFALGFSTGEIGMLGSAHFVGFFIGCWFAPRLMGSVGHSRAYVAFAAAGAMGLLGHMLILDAYAWALMRVASGLCIAGCYTVIEAWLQARVTNTTRGRTMGLYRTVDIGASLAAQLMIGVLEPASYVSYNIMALLCVATLIPVALTTTSQPGTPEAPRLRPSLAIARSPLGVAAVIVAAITSASFRMVGPIYGQAVGLSTDQIAWFLASFVFGGAISQYPVGWIADNYDRRGILIALSVAAIGSSVLSAALTDLSTMMIMISAGVFGLTTFPIFSVAAAHAHDFASDDERVELSAALMFWYAVGAIGAPYMASLLIQTYGAEALFAMIALAHAGLVIFGIIRMRARPAAGQRTEYVTVPRTSFLIGRLLRRNRPK